MTSAFSARHKSDDKRSIWTGELACPQATTALAHAFTKIAEPGLCVLLAGPVGAGKSYFARAAIQALMSQYGGVEDVPSPSFTLVQTYELGTLDVWHADLYRVTNPDELIELGLDQASDTALCLIEWPDRLGDLRPEDVIEITLTPDPTDEERRAVRIEGPKHLIDRLKLAMEASVA